MKFRLPFTNKQLLKIATAGAVFVGGQALLMHYLTLKRFHQSPYFMNAASVVLSHKGLLSYLGEPVAFGNPDLSDSKNFSTPNEANFEIPLKGSKTKGKMSFSAIRKTDAEEVAATTNPNNANGVAFHGWNVTNLEVTVDDRPNEKVVLVRKTYN